MKASSWVRGRQTFKPEKPVAIKIAISLISKKLEESQLSLERAGLQNPELGNFKIIYLDILSLHFSFEV